MSDHRRPAIPYTDAPRGTCRWCGESIVHPAGPKQGRIDYRRRWHPACVDAYNATDPRELRRRVRRRDRGICRACGLDTNALRREIRGRGRAARLRSLGFVPRRSLWELDHVVPLIDGGGHELENLQTLCVPCHRKKSVAESRVRRAGRDGGGSDRARDPAQKPVFEEPACQEPAPDALDALFARADRQNARIEAALRGDR